jgi:hypothetical protein
VLEAVCLVPALREDIEGDLSTDRKTTPQVSISLSFSYLSRSACL